MSFYRFIVSYLPPYFSATSAWLQVAQGMGLAEVSAIDYQDIYLIAGVLDIPAQQALMDLLHDPLVQKCQLEIGIVAVETHSRQQVVERLLKPGVTDVVGERIQKAAQLLGITTITQVASGHRWQISTTQALGRTQWQRLLRRLGIDTILHQYQLGVFQSMPMLPVVNTSLKLGAEILPLRDLNDVALLVLSQSRRLALNLIEMQAIQRYYQAQARDPTDIELEMIAQTWSEHCSHKSFRAVIQYGAHSINGLLKTYLQAATEAIQAPWVASAFVDNAGIIDFDEDWQLAFKVETHNHPSAIEPFGGANTGLGGVIRDVLGVSARPIAATDVFGLGFPSIDLSEVPAGSLHPRIIRSGVVSGVEDYGNKMGIPTVNGAVVYDAGYTANPLVFCGCVGLLPKDRHPHCAQAGDRIIILGGRTGRDGLGGATFSSQTMNAQQGEVAGAVVQIGDPIIARGLVEVITRARDQGLYHAITDCGAGGFSSAIGEMAHQAGCGAEIFLHRAPLKYPGLQAWEIWLSESQERMVLAVPSKAMLALQDLCHCYEVDLTDLGYLTHQPQIQIKCQDKLVLQLDCDFLYDGVSHGGMPRKQFTISPFVLTVAAGTTASHDVMSQVDYEAMLLKLLSHPNIASKAAIIRRYDHEIQGGAVIRALVGVCNDGPSDACVIKPQGTQGLRGLVLSNGINPELGKYDPYRMAVSVIDEAVRNAVAVGADPDRIAILDNFCWGDLECPETLAALVECARGCYDAALHYHTPFISGKDSLNNEYQGPAGVREAIPGTLLISALGVIEDITRTVSMDFKQAANTIYLLGETKTHWGGSHFVRCGGEVDSAEVPDLPVDAPQLYRSLHHAIQQGWIRACHDLSEGGLAVGLAEMCIGGRLGCTVVLDGLSEANLTSTAALFSESNGRLLIEVAPQYCQVLEGYFSHQGLSKLIQCLGQVEANQHLCIQHGGENCVDLPVDQLVVAWQR